MKMTDAHSIHHMLLMQHHSKLDFEGGSWEITETEFVVGMLVQLGLVTWQQAQPFISHFKHMDADKNGHVTEQELIDLAVEMHRKHSVNNDQIRRWTRGFNSTSMALEETPDLHTERSRNFSFSVDKARAERLMAQSHGSSHGSVVAPADDEAAKPRLASVTELAVKVSFSD